MQPFIERPVVFSPDTSTHNSAHRAACVVQATASLNDLWFGGNDAYLQAMKGLNLSNEIDPRMDSTVKACVDSIPCLSAVAAERNHTPQVMGHIIAQQTYMYGTKDGFNELGTDDGCVVSCRQFSDTTGYAPSNEPGRWQPLKESNGRGFFYFQEFVSSCTIVVNFLLRILSLYASFNSLIGDPSHRQDCRIPLLGRVRTRTSRPRSKLFADYGG